MMLLCIYQIVHDCVLEVFGYDLSLNHQQL